MKIIKPYLLVAFVCVVISCEAQKNNSSMVLAYSDGSGNYYKITQDSIIYDPISPEMSSSGFYSGGEPAEKNISKQVFIQIHNKFVELSNNKQIHLKNRIKTSGQLFFNRRQKGEYSVIVAAGEELQQLEQLLKEALK